MCLRVLLQMKLQFLIYLRVDPSTTSQPASIRNES